MGLNTSQLSFELRVKLALEEWNATLKKYGLEFEDHAHSECNVLRDKETGKSVSLCGLDEL